MRMGTKSTEMQYLESKISTHNVEGLERFLTDAIDTGNPPDREIRFDLKHYLYMFEDAKQIFETNMIRNECQQKHKNHWAIRHLRNVGIYSKVIAEVVKQKRNEYFDKRIKLLTDALFCAGLLHDIGKLVMRNPELLDKKLDEVTLRRLKKEHLELGSAYFNANRKYGQSFASFIYYSIYLHHERKDGSGYLLGLKGDNIPPYVQIVMLADFLDSKTLERDYYKEVGIELISEEEAKLTSIDLNFENLIDIEIYDCFLDTTLVHPELLDPDILVPGEDFYNSYYPQIFRGDNNDSLHILQDREG